MPYKYIYICSNVQTEAPFIRIRIFFKPHEISESLAHPWPIRIKNYNVSKISGSCGRAGSEIDSNFKNRQTKHAETKTKRQNTYMVGFTLPVERIQSDNKGKIDTKRALTNRNLHCKETIQCNLR